MSGVTIGSKEGISGKWRPGLTMFGEGTTMIIGGWRPEYNIHHKRHVDARKASAHGSVSIQPRLGLFDTLSI